MERSARVRRSERPAIARVRFVHPPASPPSCRLPRRRLGRAFQRVDELDVRLAGRDPRLRLAAIRGRLERAAAGLADRVKLSLGAARAGLESLAAQLAQLSPLEVLERGYAIVQNELGRIVKDSAEAPVDSAVRIRLARGRLKARVTESGPNGRTGPPFVAH